MRRPLISLLRCAVAGAVLLCGLGALRADARKDVKVALVIGNSNYSADSLKLANAARDAKDIAETLKQEGFDVQLKTDVSKSDFDQILADYARASESADISLFYYAGHGVQYKRQNYMLPTDNIPKDNKDIKFRSVPLQDIVDAASYARKAKIIILDACRNSKPDPAKKVAATRSVTGVGDGDGLAEVTATEGLAVFFSAQAGHQALDADGGEHSPFAQAMLKHLIEPNRNVVNVFDDVTHDVKVATQDMQVPETFNSLGETIILNPRETSAEVWARIKQARDPKALRQFIADYPEAPEADAAQAILDEQDAERRAAQKAAENAKRLAELQALLDQASQQKEALEKAEAEAKAAEEKRRAEEAAKAKAESDKLAAQLAEQRAQAERLKAQQLEAEKAREEEERLALEAAEEQKRRDAAERQRRDAEAAEAAAAAARAQAEVELARRRAEIETDLRAKDAAQREADEKTRLAEQERRRAEMLAQAREHRADLAAVQQKDEEDARAEAARLEQAKRQREAEEQQKKIVAAACAADAGRLAEFTRSGEVEQIDVLRRESICPTTADAADKAIAAVAIAAAKTCEAETKALSRLDAKNAAALTAAADGFKCPAVRQAATQLASDAKRAAAEMEAICAQDAASLAAIDTSLPKARDDLSALAASKCPKTRTLTDKAIAEIDERVGIAQGELVRLQCLAPNRVTQRFDEATQAALTHYLTARNAPADAPRLNQDLVDELSDQSVAVCAPAPATVEAKAAPEQPGESVARPSVKPAAPRYIVPKSAPRLVEPRIERTPEPRRRQQTHIAGEDESAPRPVHTPHVSSGGGGHNGGGGGGGGGGGSAPRPSAPPTMQFSVPAI